MKYSVFLLRSFTLLLVLASVWGYQAAAVQRSDEKAQVRAEALQIKKQREAEASKALLGKYIDGSYEGEAEGFGGPIRVRVTVSEGEIKEIDVYDHAKEDDIYFGMALSVTKQMIEENDKGYLDLKNICYIDDILKCFEREYCGARTKNGKPLIKEEYTRRLVRRR